jgi:hypothetical protein
MQLVGYLGMGHLCRLRRTQKLPWIKCFRGIRCYLLKLMGPKVV